LLHELIEATTAHTGESGEKPKSNIRDERSHTMENQRSLRRRRKPGFLSTTLVSVASFTDSVSLSSTFSAPAAYTTRRVVARPFTDVMRCSSISEVGSTAQRGLLHRQSGQILCPKEIISIVAPNAKYAALQNLRNPPFPQLDINSRLGLRRGRYGGMGIRNNSPQRSQSALFVSQSENILGFKVDDFATDHEPYNPNTINRVSEEDLVFSFEDFENNSNDSIEINIKAPTVRTIDPSTTSPMNKYVAANLLKRRQRIANGAGSKPIVSTLIRPKNIKTKVRAATDIGGNDAVVPVRFPWIPTEAQINRLKVVELKAACAERGLIMTGKKSELQHRLAIWSTAQERQRVKERLSGLKKLLELSKSNDRQDVESALEAYDVDLLRNKRMALTKNENISTKRSANNNRRILGLVDESYFNATASDDLDVDEEEDDVYGTGEDTNMEVSISKLSQSFNAPSSVYSNRDVREMYIEAKSADQAGERKRAKSILTQLREATPHDMRVVRRLARLEQEDGNISKAREILLEALQGQPDNAYLLHGLGQLERTAGNDYSAKKYYRCAIINNPALPNSYHAYGTLEHTHGNIRAALSVIKDGLKHCPSNHRLYHALGDVYLDANMLDLAEEAYLSGLKHGPKWSKGFFHTSLSFVSYSQGHINDSRTLLRQALTVNGGMHAQGVIALAQLEESEGNIQEARKVYRDAISRYEMKRQKRSPVKKSNQLSLKKGSIFDTSALANVQEAKYSQSYSGDKWINVFKSWARMEQIYGTYETTHIVLGKAARLFPDNVSMLLKWADLHACNRDAEKARMLYEAAYRVGGRNTQPYLAFAEFEMKKKHFEDAMSILERGAKAVAKSSDGMDGKNGLARLFHSWGICEYHLGNKERAEALFEDALRVTGSEEEDSALRSLILYSISRLELSRKEYLIAQHCIGLSLKENLLPGGNAAIWKQWYMIAEKMGNQHLATRCKEQALLRWEEERDGTMSDLSRLFGGRDASAANLPGRTGPAMKEMFRQTPWHNKICPPSESLDKTWYRGAKLWEL